MKKSAIIVIASIMCVVGIVIGVSAQTLFQKVQAEIRDDFTIVVDGMENTFKTADGKIAYPLLYNGTTYLPLRAIGELMGKTVYWYEEDKRIELKDSPSTVTDADVIVGSGADQTTGNNAASSNSNTNTNTNTTAGEITVEKAKEIALAKAGLTAKDVQFVKADVDYDRGVKKYEIEFYKNGVEYSADISAADGSILSWEVDRH